VPLVAVEPLPPDADPDAPLPAFEPDVAVEPLPDGPPLDPSPPASISLRSVAEVPQAAVAATMSTKGEGIRIVRMPG
jgi:hypothetical protein